MACIYVASYVKKKVKCPAMKMEEKTDLVPLTVKVAVAVASGGTPFVAVHV